MVKRCISLIVFLSMFLTTILSQNVFGATTDYYVKVEQDMASYGTGTLMFGDTETKAMTIDDKNTIEKEGNFSIQGQQSSDVSIEAFDVSDQEFIKAFRIKTFNRSSNAQYWMASLKANIDKPVKQGDVIFMQVYIKNEADNNNLTGFGISEAGMKKFDNAAYTSWGVRDGKMRAASNWKKCYFVFKASADVDPAQTPEEAWLEFFVYQQLQTIDIGGIAVINYGQKDQSFIDSLPVTQLNLNYDGRDVNAAWRTEADQRIDQIRKGNMTITVKDEQGNVVPDATVNVKMKKHAFSFGTAISSPLVNGTDTNSLKYKQILKENFNKVVFDNDMKWQCWTGEWDANLGQSAVEKAMPWLLNNGFKVRGHVFVYPNDGNTPNAYKTAEGETLSNAINNYINTLANNPSVKSNITDWDVLNEATSSKDVQNKLSSYYNSMGKTSFADMYSDWFNQAALADPNAKLYYTNANMLPLGKEFDWSQDAANISYIQSRVPIGGIGEQGHFGVDNAPSPIEVINRLANTKAQFPNLDIGITEFDVDIDRNDSQQVAFQADYTRDFLTAAFSSPSVSQILSWGFWEGAHWIPSAAYYNRDWTIRPNGQAYRDLVYGKWWTNENGTTDSQGQYSLRGFYGDYEIDASKGNDLAVSNISHTQEGTQIELVLKQPVFDNVTATVDRAHIKQGETANITAAGFLEGGMQLPGQPDSIVYTSSDNNIATVSNTGVVTGIKSGTVAINVEMTAYGDIKSTSVNISVKTSTPPTGTIEWSDNYDYSPSYQFSRKVIAHSQLKTDGVDAGWLPAILDGSNPAFESDTGTLFVLNKADYEYLTYKIPNVKSFSAKFIMNSSSKDDASIKFLVSSDNVTYNEVTCDIDKPLTDPNQTNWWFPKTYSCYEIPDGMNYLKVQVKNGSGWAVGLNKLTTWNFEPQKPTVSWTDSFNPSWPTYTFSDKVISHTGNWMSIANDDWSNGYLLSDTKPEPSTIAYNIKDIAGFEAKTRINVDAHYKFYASGDNTNWTELSTSETARTDRGGYWFDSVITCNTVPAGTNYLKAEVTVVDGTWASGLDYITIKSLIPDTTAPGEVTQQSVTPGDGQLTISWIDPTDEDLAKVKIVGEGITITPVEVSAGVGTAAVSGLANGTEYSIRIKTVDESGNESEGVVVNGTPVASTVPKTISWTDSFNPSWPTFAFSDKVISHTGNWMSIANDDWSNGYLLSDTKTEPSTIVYNINDIAGFEAKTRINVDAQYKFYASGDNINWTELSTSETARTDRGSYWYDSIITCDTVPAGTNYLKAGVTVVDGTWASGLDYITIKSLIPDTKSDNANLSTLIVSQGTLSPEFDPNVDSYAVNVANNVTSLDLTATVADTGKATLKVDGVIQNSAQSKTVTLNPGENTVIAEVTAENGIVKKEYTINIVRAQEFSLGNVAFKNLSGNTINSLTDNGSVTASISAANTTSQAKSAVIVVALYNSNQDISMLAYTETQIGAGETKSISAGFNLPVNVTGYTLKAFVWDSLSGMQPISNVQTITK